MAFDGLVLNSVVQELKNTLMNGKIQKIYQPSSDEILFSIYANNLSYALTCNSSSNFYSVHLTTSKKENPLVAPNFCMLLRKHLMGYKITNISTINNERIFVMELAGNDDDYKPITKKLIVELMGKHSNILLVNSENIIIDSLKHFHISDGAYRDTIPNAKYILPISNKINISCYKELNLNENNSLTEFFTEHFSGISKNFISYSIEYLGITNILNINNYNTLAKYILDIEDAILQCKVSAEYYNNDYVLIMNNNAKTLQVNLFLDDYYTKKERSEQFLSYRNQLLQFILAKVKKLSKKLNAIDEKLKECENTEKYKLYGELITSYLYKIPDKHISQIELNNYYNNNDIVSIPLDISISPAENAKRYFKKYHKLKNALSIVQSQKNELEKEIDYLESIVYEIQSAKSINDLDEIYDEIEDSFSNSQKQKNKKQVKKKKAKNETKIDPIIYNIDGFKILVGKNNKQNDILTFKMASKEDLWFHVKDIHGSHVILVTNGSMPSQEVINKCASITAYHSKAIQSSNVSVDYTLVKYVKKPKLAKHGMVIYTNQKTITVKPKKETS